MNRIFLAFIFSFSFVFVSAQNEGQLYFYQVSIPNFESFEITKKEDGSLEVFSMESFEETQIYKKAKVYEFQRAFPNTKKPHLQIVYRITTNSPNLMDQLQRYNPDKYSRLGEYFPTPNAFYPNDYGTTSPVENLGAPYPLTGLDLMNVPGAWGITTGSKKVVIGISDAKIDSTNIDLQGRISNYLIYFNHASGTACSHGTGVASIIGAKMDNAFGLPGICSDCDMIAAGYGQFDHIEKLVQAGAKVINVSWVLCGFGAYHKNIEERINEYYDEGILIVAGAGNGRRCNRNLRDWTANYTYPASYKRVISVTSVFADCEYYEDCIEEHEQFGTVVKEVKDRHVVTNILRDGKLFPVNVHWGTQHNLAVSIAAPARTYLAGRADCGNEEEYGGMTSTSTAMVTGIIGLIWSVNYCLGSAEVESIIKLTSANIEDLPGNEPFKMQLGAGRIDAYKSVKMAHDMQLEEGIVEVTGRDFYRFEFELKSSPYQIDIWNQTFRDSTTVDFKARKRIHLKPNTHLKPDSAGFVKLSIDPDLPTEECFPKIPEPKPKIEKDSVYSAPQFTDPFNIHINESINGVEVQPVEEEIDSDYEVTIELGGETIFKQRYQKLEVAHIPLPNIENEMISVSVMSDKFYMNRNLRINDPRRR